MGCRRPGSVARSRPDGTRPRRSEHRTLKFCALQADTLGVGSRDRVPRAGGPGHPQRPCQVVNQAWASMVTWTSDDAERQMRPLVEVAVNT